MQFGGSKDAFPYPPPNKTPMICLALINHSSLIIATELKQGRFTEEQSMLHRLTPYLTPFLIAGIATMFLYLASSLSRIEQFPDVLPFTILFLMLAGLFAFSNIIPTNLQPNSGGKGRGPKKNQRQILLVILAWGGGL